MMNAAIMNDFSQYRRSVGKLRDHPSASIKEVEANNISMWIAMHIPMTSTLAKTFSDIFKEVGVLTRISSICLYYYTYFIEITLTFMWYMYKFASERGCCNVPCIHGQRVLWYVYDR